MPPKKSTTKVKSPVRIETLTHEDTRVNIPTADAHDFVSAEAKQVVEVRYPRDPALDPQLVWKGKEAQNSEDLVVGAPPIYIQEKIDPRVLVENLRATAARPEDEPELRLFETFDGLDGLESIEFYEHEANWSNRLILGDSLEVMASLAEREQLRGRIQMIYFDPPYGIRFKSNWQVSTRDRQVGNSTDDATRQVEQIRAFRDTWELGIHSYLAYLRDRLSVARELLTDSGSLFMQIGDENVHLVRSVLDEVFGIDCHVVTIVVKKKGGQRSGLLDPVNDYLLWYSKAPRKGDQDGIKFRPVFEDRELDAETLGEFKSVELPDGRVFALKEVPAPDGTITDYRVRPQQLFRDYPGARLFRSNPLTGGGVYRTQAVPYTFDGTTFSPGRGQSWKHSAMTDDGSPCGMDRIAWSGRLIAGESTWRFKSYFDDFPYKSISNWWDGLGGASDPIYVVQTNTEIIARCILMTTDPGDLVLDPTCGSGTTAYVAEQWGRRWITIDTSRVALTLARTRLMAAQYRYYVLADSEEGASLEEKLTGVSASEGPFMRNVRKGFILKRSAHVTSSYIANNPEIVEDMDPEGLHEAILRHSDVELLVDQPYVQSGTVRVAGPFTVESLAPHRTVVTDGGAPASEAAAADDPSQASFEQTILENLLQAGVQNGLRAERLELDALELLPAKYLIGKAIRKAEEGEPQQRVAISIGPRYGTVGPDWVKAAAREALRGEGFDVLLVLGFAFDPRALETVEEFHNDDSGFAVQTERSDGGLRILLTRMNADLAMGESLLKKTKAANLFTVFGEPDVDVREADDGWVVKVRGFDVYNPITGEVRSGTVDDIALWMIDTNYNEESFFVRDCYFLGDSDPYEKLKKALRAEIDDAAWATMYSDESRPFVPPSTGKIAVKLINHLGDEVLKIIDLSAPGS